MAAMKTLLGQLGMSAQQLMRNKEAIYKELNLKDSSLTEDQLIEAMINNPKLIERPIVVNGDKAKIGRPPEQVLELF
jgi:arsenate reductase